MGKDEKGLKISKKNERRVRATFALCCCICVIVRLPGQYIMSAVLRGGGYSMMELVAKEKEELYSLRSAALGRQVAVPSH
jgi:hypothetical protein